MIELKGKVLNAARKYDFRFVDETDKNNHSLVLEVTLENFEPIKLIVPYDEATASMFYAGRVVKLTLEAESI